MKALLKIEWIRLRRTLWVFLLSIGMPVLFFLIFSSTIQFDDPVAKKAFVQSYMLTMTSFSMSGFALFSFPMLFLEDRKENWLHFIQHAPIPISRYYLSKFFRIYLCFVCCVICVFFVGHVVRGVEMEAVRWLVSALLLLISGLVYLAIGFVLSLLSSENSISVLANLLYFGLAIMGGSWMPISFFPDWVQAICKLTPGYHVNELVTQYAQEGIFLWKSLLIILVYAIICIGITFGLNKRKEEL